MSILRKALDHYPSFVQGRSAFEDQKTSHLYLKYQSERVDHVTNLIDGCLEKLLEG